MWQPLRHVLCLALLRGALGVTRLLASNPFNTCTENSGKVHSQPDAPQLPQWSGLREDFFNDYRQWHDIEHFVTQLQSTYSEVVAVKTLGKSWEGRSMLAIELTNRSVDTAPADKPCIMLMGGIHAREWIAPATVLFLAEGIAKSALLEQGAASRLLREYVLTIIPVANPDGYHHSWTVNRMWRKTRSNAATCASKPGNVAGVDANRNWDYMWRVTNDRYYKQELSSPCTNVYAGPRAFSEPEVLSIATYMQDRQNRSWNLSYRHADGDSIVVGPGYIAAFIDYHSYAQMLLPPWGYTSDMPAVQDTEYQTGLTKAMVANIQNTSGRHFQAGANLFPSSDPGTGPDWAYGKLGVRASMTIELEGPYVSHTGFCWPEDQIRSVGEEQLAALLTMTEYLLHKGAEPSEFIGLHAKSKWQNLPATPPNSSTDVGAAHASTVQTSSTVLLLIGMFAFF
eukprot:gb/GFBE01019717.1/.p1 GENE.gb/GFBE01019717.1/~~gb/GFBE01019717.1/.p1  ORF type:complete len:454 (+),score=72.12 gb/GFBE01019717.1/:1-1362(+)